MRRVNISFDVYNFDELSDGAKETARTKWRMNNDEDYSDEVNCLEEIGCIIGKAKYEIDAWNNVHVSISPEVDEDVESLIGVRAMVWIWNNWIEPNMKGKCFSKLECINGEYKYKERYSKATKTWDCPLTGASMDMIMYESYKAMQKGLKSEENWRIEDYVEEVRNRFKKEWQAEIDYRNSDEYIDKELKINNYEFTSCGNLFA